MNKSVLVPLAEGFEEVEALSIVDVLRRAGAEVTTAAVGTNRQVAGAHQVTVTADAMIDDCDGPYDMIALPGGIPGADNLAASAKLEALLREQDDAGRHVAAICASPAVVLQKHGLIKGRKVTCYPSFADQLEPITHVPDRVVVDGTLITGSGPGSALEFSLKLVEALYDTDKAKGLQEGMLVK